LLLAAAAMLSEAAAHAAQHADLILHNGKIVTVDDRFTIAQALAIKDGHIVAVGPTSQIEKLADDATKKIDLGGKTVIPGLIDNHAHFVRAIQQWGLEVRWDGVASRAQAVRMLRERVQAARPGEWVAVLGGWSLDQFADDQRAFTLAELDAIAPNNPIALQLIYIRAFLNSSAIEALGLRDQNLVIRGGRVERDASGAPSGVIEGGGAATFLRDKLPQGDPETRVAYARKLFRDLNELGLTAYIDWGGYGFSESLYEPVRTLHQRGEMTVRVFHGTWDAATNAEQTERVIEKIKTLTPFQGDDYFDRLGYGETVFLPLHDNPSARNTTVPPEQLALWRRIAQAVADRGLNLSVHANQRASIEAFVSQIEEINKVKPIRGLRWSLAHVRQLEQTDIDRLRRLGMYVMPHSQATISGAELYRVYGDRAFDQPPIRMIQDSGIPWGLGSDANGAAPANPFYTLSLAVTGRMIGGRLVNRQTITREQALIAHTRNNAYFAFRESNLGSLQKGKYADLLVLDHDYLKVPAEQIKDIKPLLTMVGGKVVYQRSKP
jgi:predicted amidohydrolase YtcJ